MSFVYAAREPVPADRSLYMQGTCLHDGFHDIHSAYDRQRRVLSFVLTCERCGAELGELRRQLYWPHYDPSGSDRFLASRAYPPRARSSQVQVPGIH
jgi:hypothetical protein